MPRSIENIGTLSPNVRNHFQIRIKIYIGEFIGEAAFLENSSNRQFLSFGALHRPIGGKLIQNTAFNKKIIVHEFRGVTQTVLLENSSIYITLGIREILFFD